MNETPYQELQRKAELYDLWEHARKHVRAVYDFDTTMSADELKDSLSEIISLEAFGDH